MRINFSENLVLFLYYCIAKDLQNEEFCTFPFICNITVFFKNIFWSLCDKTQMVCVDFQVFALNSRYAAINNTQFPTAIQITEGE